MSNVKIPFNGRPVPFFRKEGTLDVRLVPNRPGEHSVTMIDLGFDFKLFEKMTEIASAVLSHQISNNLQV